MFANLIIIVHIGKAHNLQLTNTCICNLKPSYSIKSPLGITTTCVAHSTNAPGLYSNYIVKPTIHIVQCHIGTEEPNTQCTHTIAFWVKPCSKYSVM